MCHGRAAHVAPLASWKDWPGGRERDPGLQRSWHGIRDSGSGSRKSGTGSGNPEYGMAGMPYEAGGEGIRIEERHASGFSGKLRPAAT